MVFVSLCFQRSKYSVFIRAEDFVGTCQTLHFITYGSLKSEGVASGGLLALHGLTTHTVPSASALCAEQSCRGSHALQTPRIHFVHLVTPCPEAFYRPQIICDHHTQCHIELQLIVEEARG